MHLKASGLIFGIFFLMCSSLLCAVSPINQSKPVLFYANSQSYDSELGILILKGNVEFAQDGTILEADYVTYNEHLDLVTASGNVRLRRPDKTVSFAEYVELTGDLKRGLTMHIRALIENNGKIVAREGRRLEEREEFDKGVYTSCNLCGSDSPVWQINAERIVKDNQSKDISFMDAQLRMFNVPIAYMPYLTSPSERRSGFLVPRPGFFDKEFGASLEIPYFFALSRDKDITISPVYFAKKNPLLKVNYRQAFKTGRLWVDGSITRYKFGENDPKKGIPKIRGHIFAKKDFSLGDNWFLKAEGGRVSDQTYFRRYKYLKRSSDNTFTSKATVEKFLNTRDYLTAKVYHFYGLNTNVEQEKVAHALPAVEYQAYSDVDKLGGRFKFDAQFLNIYRELGTKFQRGVTEIEWRAPFHIPLGQLINVFASLRGDIYNRYDYTFTKNGKLVDENGVAARFFPQAGIEWRWPFINNVLKEQIFVIEPIVQFIGAPHVKFSKKIPNEDSQGFEFDDVSLLSSKRIPGYDIIDNGNRANYALHFMTSRESISNLSLKFGQSYAFTTPTGYDAFNRMEKGFSDWVGRVEASPYKDWASLNYRFFLDKKTLEHNYSEVGFDIGQPIARVATTYLFVDKKSNNVTSNNFNQLGIQFSSKFSQYWSFSLNNRRDFRKKSKGGGELSRTLAINYTDECFSMGLNVGQAFYRDRDIRPGTSFMLVISFANLGAIPISSYVDQALFDEDNQ